MNDDQAYQLLFPRSYISLKMLRECTSGFWGLRGFGPGKKPDLLSFAKLMASITVRSRFLLAFLGWLVPCPPETAKNALTWQRPADDAQTGPTGFQLGAEPATLASGRLIFTNAMEMQP